MAEPERVDTLRVSRGRNAAQAPVHFTFQGQVVIALAGESIGAALWAAGHRTLRLSPTGGTPRGMFCVMGSCQECAVLVGGTVRTACNTIVQPGLDVRSIDRREPSDHE